jgi:hypothetical protein
MATDISWTEVVVAPATVVRALSASQTMGDFGQTATAGGVASGTFDISHVSLAVPEGANATRDLEAAQTMGDFVQVASMFDPIGTIDGGGTITDGLPHKSLSATQTMDDFVQSAAIGEEGALGAVSLSAVQTMGDFGQAFAADAQRFLAALQTMGDFTQVAQIGDPPVVVQPAPTIGTPGYEGPRRYKTKVKGKTITSDTYDGLRRAVLALDDDEPVEMPPKVATKIRSVTVSPVEMLQAEIARMESQQQRQIAELQTQMMTATQQMAQSYENRVASAEQAAQSAFAMAQRARMDADALSALITN